MVMVVDVLSCRKKRNRHPKANSNRNLSFAWSGNVDGYDWKNETLSSIMPQNVKIAELTICERTAAHSCNWKFLVQTCRCASARFHKYSKLSASSFFRFVDETAFWINSRQWKQCLLYRIVHRTRYSIHLIDSTGIRFPSMLHQKSNNLFYAIHYAWVHCTFCAFCWHLRIAADTACNKCIPHG